MSRRVPASFAAAALLLGATLARASPLGRTLAVADAVVVGTLARDGEQPGRAILVAERTLHGASPPERLSLEASPELTHRLSPGSRWAALLVMPPGGRPVLADPVHGLVPLGAGGVRESALEELVLLQRSPASSPGEAAARWSGLLSADPRVAAVAASTLASRPELRDRIPTAGRARVARLALDRGLPPSARAALISLASALDLPVVESLVEDVAGGAPPAVVEAVAAALPSEPSDARDRVASLLLHALGRAADEHVPDLVRLGAALRHPDLLPEIHELARSSNRRLRLEVIGACDAFGDPSSRDVLQSLAAHPDPDTARAARHVLAGLPSAAALEGEGPRPGP